MNRPKPPRPCEYTARALLVCATLFAARPATAGAIPVPSPFTVESLPALPDPEGFAGLCAGVTQGALLVAGGANIPKNRWQDPIQKSWYHSVWILEKSGTSWIPTSPLPEPLAYGVSVTIPEGVLCIGGSSPDRHHTAVFALNWENRTLTTRSYPPLPSPCAHACGALVGRTVFVAGGTAAPSDTTALRQFLALDLDHLEAGWQQLPPWPGPGRILGVAGSADGGFHLFSGSASPAAPRESRSALISGTPSATGPAMDGKHSPIFHTPVPPHPRRQSTHPKGPFSFPVATMGLKRDSPRSINTPVSPETCWHTRAGKTPGRSRANCRSRQ